MAELRRGNAWSWAFKMVDEGDFATPEPGKSPVVQMSRDGGAFINTVNIATEIGNGWYRVQLTGDETAADVLVLRATASGCAQTDGAFHPPTHTASSAIGPIADAVLCEAIDEHKGIAGSLAAAVNVIRQTVAGKRDQTIATGVIRIYDTDGVTVLVTLTPAEAGGVLTLE